MNRIENLGMIFSKRENSRQAISHISWTRKARIIVNKFMTANFKIAQ